MGFLNRIKRIFHTTESTDSTAGDLVAVAGKQNVGDVKELEIAIKLHREHDLDGAEKIYRTVLRNNLDNVRALHLLGTLHGQRGNNEEAAKHLERAAALSSSDPNILADLARVRLMEGRHEAAAALLCKAIDLAPEEASYHFALAQILIQRGDPSRAVDSFSQAVQLNPEFVEAYSDLGAAYLELGRYAPAREALESAIRLDAGCMPARFNLSYLHSLFGEFDQAVWQCQTILDADPKNEQALARLGKLYALVGEDKKALRCYEDLVAIVPDQIDFWNQIGTIAQKLGLLSKAAECYEHSLELKANQPETLVNLGAVNVLAGKLEQSVACFKSAIEVRSDLEAAYHNLGATYLSQGMHDEALESFELALKLAPHSHITFSNLIAINCYRRRGHSEYMEKLFNRYLESIAPERIMAAIPVSHDRTRQRRLRIGYVSPDFRQHSVSYFIEPALAGHNREHFEVFCYSNVARPDEKTQSLKAAAEHWRDIFGESDDSVAALIRRDRIDMLIDLNGHSADNRLLVFAQKPAPVQIAYLGYPGTTGLPEMGYRLTDAIADPPGESEREFTEMLVRFPQVFLCYKRPDSAPAVSTVQDSRGPVCFGSFNELPKISPEVVRIWSAILVGVPGSTLLLKARAFSDKNIRSRVFGWFHDAGVESSRVELLGRTPSLEAHLALYARIDIALDTFPYNGTTTTCEALYMGVPVVTLFGDVHASRVGASLLTAIGLHSLIAETEDAYIKKAIVLAGDFPERARLRKTLRGRMLDSALTDEQAFVKNLESIYSRLWDKWCDDRQLLIRKSGAEEHEKATDIRGAIKIKLADSDAIWLPSDLNRLSTYVLCEQETWFEDEFEFLCNYLEKGMRVLDIGANFGVYTLLAAARVGRAGRVWGVEPASTTYRWLCANVRYNDYVNTRLMDVALSDFNGVVNLQIFPDAEYNRLCADETSQAPGELVDVWRLDSCVVDKGISSIDFVKIDAEGAEKQILDGGRRFFADETPLVMFEIKSGSESDWTLVEKFQDLGYSVFRLVPGLGCLVPVGEPEALDPFALNLFACGPERQAGLSDRGLLVSPASANAPDQAADEKLVWHFFEERAFSRDLVDVWRPGINELNAENRDRLLRVLSCYVSAHDSNHSSVYRFARLTQAYENCVVLNAGEIEPALQMVRARVATELGLRMEAVNILDSLLSFENLKGAWCTRIPFLPASTGFDTIVPGLRIHDWCEATVLDAFLRISAFSTYFMGADRLLLLERLRDTGFEGPAMERRRLLLSARLGRKTKAPSERLRRASRDNLNPAFWRKFRPEELQRTDAG